MPALTRIARATGIAAAMVAVGSGCGGSPHPPALGSAAIAPASAPASVRALASFAQQAPRAVADRAHATPAAAGAAGYGHRETGAEIRRRDAWFYRQRAFPAKSIPRGAFARAVHQERVLRRRSLDRARITRTAGAPATGAPATPRALPPSPAALNWRPVGPRPIRSPGEAPSEPWSGRVTALATHPTHHRIAYLGGAVGGVWKTEDDGLTWTPTWNGQPTQAIGALAIDPRHPDTVYAGTGEANGADAYYGQGVFRTTNGGSTWARINTLHIDNCSIPRVVVKPGDSRTIGVAANDTHNVEASSTCPSGVYVSRDGGGSWTRETQNSPSELSIDAGHPSTWYLATDDGGIQKSLDSGGTWQTLHSPAPPDMSRALIAVAPGDSKRVYFTAANSHSKVEGLWTSANGGASWSRRLAPRSYKALGDQADYDFVLTVDPRDSGTVYVGGAEVVGRYTRFGRAHSEVLFRVHPDFHALVFDAVGRLWVGSDGGAYRTTGPGHITNLNRTLALTQFSSNISGAGSGTLVGGTQDNGTVRFTGSRAWAEIGQGDGGYSAVSPAHPKVVYYTSQYDNTDYIYKSTDGGATYEVADKGIKVSEDALFYAPLAISPTNPRRLYAGGSHLWVTDDGAAQWHRASPQSFYSVNAIGVASDNATVYVGTVFGDLEVSRDGGATFTDTSGNGVPSAAITDFAVDPRDAGVAYVSTSGFGHGHVFRTTDYGGHWTDVSSNLPDAPINALAVDWRTTPERVYAGGDVGTFWSSAPGAAWVDTSVNLPTAPVFDLQIDTATNRLVAATHGRSAFQAPLPTSGPPANDAFSRAYVLSGRSAYRGDDTNEKATREPGEPRHAGAPGGASVWYRWTAPASGPVTIGTRDSDFDTSLGVYTGSSVGSLRAVASNDDAAKGVRTSRVRFTARAGRRYRIAVDGYDAGAGPARGRVAIRLSLPARGRLSFGRLGGSARQTRQGHLLVRVHSNGRGLHGVVVTLRAGTSRGKVLGRSRSFSVGHSKVVSIHLREALEAGTYVAIAVGRDREGRRVGVTGEFKLGP
jgi:photosystem II stability/assembly factor-like uncharacterized protein